MIKTNAEYLYDDDLADPDLAELFAALHTQGSGAAPTMRADLAALLGTASAPTVLARRRDRRTARRAGAAAILASGLVGVGISVGAAAVGVLPDPAQRVVSDVVGRLTRIELPRPDTSPRQPEQDLDPDVDSGTVAPVVPEDDTALQPSDADRDGVAGARGSTVSSGGGQRDSDEEATGDDEAERDSDERDGEEAAGTSDTEEGASRDSSGRGSGEDSDSDSDRDSDRDLADQGGDSAEEGRSSSGDGEVSDRERSERGDSGSDGADEE